MSGGEGQAIGTLDVASGGIGAIRADGTRVSLQAGDPVFQADVIATDPGAAASIVFVDSSVLSFGRGSRIVLENMNHGGDSTSQVTVSVHEGVFVAVPGTLVGDGAGIMVLTIPTATIIVRGAAVGGLVDPLAGHARIGVLPAIDAEAETRGGSITITTAAGAQETITGSELEIRVSGETLSVLPLSPLDASQLFHPAYTETLARSGMDVSYLSVEGFITEAGAVPEQAGAGEDAASPPLFISDQIAPMERVVVPIVPRRGPLDVALNEPTAGIIDHSARRAE